MTQRNRQLNNVTEEELNCDGFRPVTMTKETKFELFDALPPELREFLRDASIDWSPSALTTMLAQGAPVQFVLDVAQKQDAIMAEHLYHEQREFSRNCK